MKLTIVGAQSTGKSSLLLALKEKLPDWQYVEESTRWVLKYGLKINREANYDTQQMIMMKHLFTMFQFTPDQNVIYDRSCLDCLIYSSVLRKNNGLTEEQWQEFFNIAVQTWSLFDEYIYLPIEFDAVADGVRDPDEEYRKEIDTMFQGLFTSINKDTYGAFNKRLHTVTGSIEERVEKVLEIINGRE